MKKLGLVALVGRKQRRKDERKQVKQRKSAGGRIDAAPPAVAKRKLAPETATKADQTMSALKKAKRDHQREKLAKAVPTDPLILRDAQEIAYLESKLGVKKGGGGRNKLAKEFEEDGLGGEFINFLDSLDHLVGSEQSDVDSEAEAYARERDAAYEGLPTDDEEEEEEDDTGDEQMDTLDSGNKGSQKKVKFAQNADEDDEGSESESGSESEDEDEEESTEEARPAAKGIVSTGKASKRLSSAAIDENPLIKREDEEIAYLEKKLGMSKEGRRSKVYEEMDTNEFGEGFGSFLEDLDGLSQRLRKDAKRDKKVVAIYDGGGEDSAENSWSEEESNEEDGSEEGAEDSVDGSEASHDDEDDEEEEVPQSTADTYRPTSGEDIYGRPLDSAASKGAAVKYVPPALRGGAGSAIESTERAEQLQRLNRKVTGCLNRLAEATLEHTAREIAPLFDSAARAPGQASAHAAADVTEAITNGILRVAVSETQVLKGLAPCAAALVVALNVLLRAPPKGVSYGRGADLMGASFVERLATELVAALAQDGYREGTWQSSAMEAGDGPLESKKPANLVLLLSALYNMGLVQVQLVSGLLHSLASRLSPLDLNLMLVLLREVGPRLRSDDKGALSKVVDLVKSRTNDDAATSKRVAFMEEELENLKKAKGGHGKKGGAAQMDDASIQRMRKVIQRLAKGSKDSSKAKGGSSQLHMSWDDLVHAETKGRWWRTGASWAGYEGQAGRKQQAGQDDDNNEASDDDDGDATSNERSNSQHGALIAAAAKLRMSTDARKAAFVAIMGADGVDDAVIRLGSDPALRGAGGREGVRVLVECCGAEKSYNPYYAAVASRVCMHDGNQRFTLQLTFWDLFKKLPSMPPRRALNLAHFGATLVAANCLPLPAMLKGASEGDNTLMSSTGTALLFFKAFFAYLMVAPVPRPPLPDPLTLACAKFGGKSEFLLIRDQVAVFLSSHLQGPLPGLSEEDAAAWPKRRKMFKKCLRDAQALYETQKALGKEGKDGKRSRDDADIPEDEWAQFYEGGV